MKKKLMIIFICCFICLFVFISEVGCWGFGYVNVMVRDRYLNPISWAHVTVGNATCWNIGYGYYSTITSTGWHCVYVFGRAKWVYVGAGYTWVYFYL